jgi:hypothetical protein
VTTPAWIFLGALLVSDLYFGARMFKRLRKLREENVALHQRLWRLAHENVEAWAIITNGKIPPEMRS